MATAIASTAPRPSSPTARSATSSWSSPRRTPTAGARGVSLLIVETDKVEGFKRGKDARQDRQRSPGHLGTFLRRRLGAGAEPARARRGQRLLPADGRTAARTSTYGHWRRHHHGTRARDYHRLRQEPKSLRQTIFDFQNTQFKLADAKAKATVAKVFVNDCIKKALDGTLDNDTSAIAKLWVTETEWQIVDDCLQMHGGYGLHQRLSDRTHVP